MLLCGFEFQDLYPVFYLEYMLASNNADIWTLLTSQFLSSLFFFIVELPRSNHHFITAITPSSVILMALESTLSVGVYSQWKWRQFDLLCSSGGSETGRKRQEGMYVLWGISQLCTLRGLQSSSVRYSDLSWVMFNVLPNFTNSHTFMDINTPPAH